MKCDKLKILLVLLILIMSIGMVSAAENVSTDSQADNGNEILAIDSDVDLISEDGYIASFTDLEDDLKDSHNGVVTLTRDYKFNSSVDNDLVKGIPVSRLTINGDGHQIDANGLSRIFDIRSGPVVLNNIKFVNGHSPKDSDAGAVLVTNGNLEVKNCQFRNNFAEKYGGAIASSSSTNSIKIYNTGFYSNTAKYHGGAIYANDVNVDKSVFDSNGVTASSPRDLGTDIDLYGLGGAIFASNVRVTNTKFNRNYVVNSGVYQIHEGGGAIAITKKLDCYNCNFTDNTGLKGGAILAIAQYPSDLKPSNYVNVVNSRFIHNVAFDGGGICSNYNVTVDRSVFDNNLATGYGGGAVNTGVKSNNNVFTNSVFYNNTAYNYGGALATSHSHIKNCQFEYNKANHGGAIFSLSFDIANSVLHDNVAIVGNNIVVVEGLKKDENTYIPESELVVYSQHAVHDFTVEVLNGQSSTDHYINSGEYEGYQQYCIEEHLFLPDHSEGVMTRDLSYIINSHDGSLVSDYLKIMFYLMDAYPEQYSAYKNKIQEKIWIFTDSDYRQSTDQFVMDIIRLYDQGFALNKTSYILPNGTEMEYDMQLFLTPTDRQNMVLFKSMMFVPRYNETVSKESINKTVYVGQEVQFRITVENTGNMNLTDVFVNDTQYSKGLVFSNKWYSEEGNWTYKNNGVWVLDHVLEPHDIVSLIVIFNTDALGILENNVTSGYLDIILSNSTDSITTDYIPKMSVIKLSNNKVVKKGEAVSFTIIVKNEGDYDITGVYVIDKDYTQGLDYDYFVDQTNSWRYRGNNRWDYDGVLKPHQTTPGLTLYFIATTTGLKYNTVTAGNNLTNETVNSTNTTTVNVTKTNTTNVTKKEIHKNSTNSSNEDNGTDIAHYGVKSYKHATGNPLFALLLVLISLGVITFRRRK